MKCERRESRTSPAILKLLYDYLDKLAVIAVCTYVDSIEFFFILIEYAKIQSHLRPSPEPPSRNADESSPLISYSICTQRESE
jgi:hypothetical protein